MIKSGTESKTRVMMFDVNKGMIVSRLVKASQNKFENMKASSNLFSDIEKSNAVLEVEHEVKTFLRYGQEQYYIRLNFKVGKQILRYELTPTGEFTHAMCFNIVGKGERSLVELGSADMNNILALIFAEFPAPVDTVIYKKEASAV
jgi:hypothetical protein